MQKVLGQDINDLDARKQFLLDNADEVVEMSYSKAFDADDWRRRKPNLPKSLSKSMTSTKLSRITKKRWVSN